MITHWDVENYSKKENCWFEIREDGIFDKGNGNRISDNLNEFVQLLRKCEHSLFKCLHHDHACLDTVYQCEECGTVIFTGDDERYNPNLRCPTCNHEEPSRGEEYWTKEDIEKDEKKQNTLKFYEDWSAYEKKSYKRKKKTGLYWNELWKKRKKLKDGNYKTTTLKYFHRDWDGKGEGLHIEIECTYKHGEDEMLCLDVDRTKRIPLTFGAWKTIRRIKKHLKELKKENIDNKNEN